MAKDPAFLLYSSDFLTGTIFMTNEEVGIYIKLMCIQHQKEGRINPQDFDRFCSGYPRVIEKFEKDENGYFNLRLQNEINKRFSATNASRSNGLKGGRPKSEKKKNPQVKKLKPKHNLSEDENEDVIEFELFYNEYPKKRARIDAQRAWVKLSKTEQRLAIDALKWWFIGVPTQFYPNPASWLNGKRWTDEPNHESYFTKGADKQLPANMQPTEL